MKVGVIGSGSIGPDLAYGFVSALARTPDAKVYLVDIKQEALEQGIQRIRGYVTKGLRRGKLNSRSAAAIESALTATLDLNDLQDCDYVLEAASEDLAVKRAILKNLETVVREDCLIGFATSGIPRAEIAAEARYPQRCFVNHPFFPAWRSLPVEVVLSDDEALGQRMIETLKRLGKVPIVTADVACFAADDIFCNYISEAARIVEEGIATPAQVDRVVDDEIGGGGPFNVMDATRGNLLTVKCQRLMQKADTGSVWFAPPAVLEAQGDQLWHAEPGASDYDEALKKQVLDRILAVLLGRSYFVVDRKICAPTDLDWMTRMALGFSTGLLRLSHELGADRVHDLCMAYAENNPGFEVSPSIRKKALPAVSSFVKMEIDGDIGVVRVFRPEVKNALSAATIREIDAAFRTLLGDAAVRGIVFTSADGALAGADINELAALQDAEQCRQICMATHPIIRRIETAEKPVVAAVDGPVMGGGAEFSMACHARVVGPRLLLSQPEVNLGIIPGYGGTQRLPRLVGVERAADLVRTGRVVGTKEAVEWGWATELAPSDPESAAKALIRRHLAGEVKLTAVNPEPLPQFDLPKLDIGHHSLAIDRILVDVMRRGLALSLDEGLAVEADGFGRCKATVDMDIGMKNFVQNGPRVPAMFIHE